MPMRSGRRKKLNALFRKQGGLCHLCGTPMSFMKQRRFDRGSRRWIVAPQELWVSLDHHLPRSKGGKTEPSNLRAAHWICNQVKNNRLIESVPLACFEVAA